MRKKPMIKIEQPINLVSYINLIRNRNFYQLYKLSFIKITLSSITIVSKYSTF